MEEEFKDLANVFDEKEKAVVNKITKIFDLRTAAEKREKELREQLIFSMKKYGVVNCSFGTWKITYIPESTQHRVDTARLKKEQPELCEKYSKDIEISEHVNISQKREVL